MSFPGTLAQLIPAACAGENANRPAKPAAVAACLIIVGIAQTRFRQDWSGVRSTARRSGVAECSTTAALLCALCGYVRMSKERAERRAKSWPEGRHQQDWTFCPLLRRLSVLRRRLLASGQDQ